MKTIILIAIILFISMNLNAYNLYKTSDGRNTMWRQYVVEIIIDYSILEISEENNTESVIESVIEDALDLWVFDANLPLSFVLIWDECDEIDNDENNCIVACYDEGKFKCNRSSDKASTAYITRNTDGRIKDVDIVVNTKNWNWSLDCKNTDGLCFQRTIAHEFGHMLGIAHSDDRDAIMYKFMRIDDDEIENLFSDDIEAAEYLYNDFVVDKQDFYEVACSTSIIGNYNKSNSIFDLLSLL